MSGRAPRVLVDATAVPADRGGVGRYVDGLISALGAAGADFAVVCQRADAERFGRMAPEATIVPGPAAIAHRPARLAWEQTGLPLVAAAGRRRRAALAALHDAAAGRPPGRGDHPRRDVLHRAGRAHARSRARSSGPRPGPRCTGRPAASCRPRRPGTSWSGCSTPTRPGSTSPTTASTRRPSTSPSDDGAPAGAGPARPARHAVRRVPRHARAAQERAEPGPRLGAGGAATATTRRRWCSPAAPAGTTRSTRRSPRCRASCACCGRATCGSPTCAASSAARTVVAYPSHGEGFGLPVLEAMACGAPVLTTQRLSLPEVGGDAVAYTEPRPGLDRAGAARAARRRRARRQRSARRRSSGPREFTWAASAEAHLALRQGGRRGVRRRDAAAGE